MAIIAAGPIANVLMVIAIYACIYVVHGMPIFLPVASSILPGTPAAVAGFHAGDRNLAVDHTPIATFEALRPLLERSPGKEMDFAVEREGKVIDLSAVLQSMPAGQPRGWISRDLE